MSAIRGYARGDPRQYTYTFAEAEPPSSANVQGELRQLRSQARFFLDAIDELSARVDQQDIEPPSPAPERPHIPRHHRDKEQFLDQMRGIFVGLKEWDFKIVYVCERLTPTLTDKTLKDVLTYHGLLVENSVKKSLNRLYTEIGPGHFLLALVLGVLLFLLLDVLSDGKLDFIIDWDGWLTD